jgi:hypothetical protein
LERGLLIFRRIIMAMHDVRQLSWNRISKVLWVFIDGDINNRAALMCPTEEDIPSKIEEYVIELDRRDHEQDEMPKIYSTMKLYIALAKLGLWDTLEEWMKTKTLPDGVNLWKAFDRANELKSDYPLFEDYLEEVKTLLNFTDEQVKNIFNASIMED